MNVTIPVHHRAWLQTIGRMADRLGLPAYAVERYGYAKARRIGVMAAIGGKHKTDIRNATPHEFRDILVAIASTAQPKQIC